MSKLNLTWNFLIHDFTELVCSYFVILFPKNVIIFYRTFWKTFWKYYSLLTEISEISPPYKRCTFPEKRSVKYVLMGVIIFLTSAVVFITDVIIFLTDQIDFTFLADGILFYGGRYTVAKVVKLFLTTLYTFLKGVLGFSTT